MVEIKKTSIESFMGPIEGQGDVGKVSLFLVSSKSPRLKKLNLEKLSVEERAAKLKSWGQEHRFVLIIEKGDMVFAHAHVKYADQLQNAEGLSLDGKNVVVKALSDRDAAQVSAIGEAFDEHVLHDIEEEIEEKLKEEAKPEKQHAHTQSTPRQQYLVRNRLVSDEVHTHFLVEQMVKRNLGNLISDCMKRFQEAREELKKQQEADDKYFDIKHTEIKKDIRRSEIKTEEVKRGEQQRRIVTEDVKRTHRTRKA